MQLGIFAKTFAAQGAIPVLQAVRGAGYEVAQFNLTCLGLPAMPEDIADSVTDSIADASARSGVAIAAVSATYNMAHPDAALRQAGLRRLAVMIAAAGAMGTGLVTLCTGTRDAADQWRHHPDNGSPEAWRDLAAQMEHALTLAERHGVDLGIEPELANVVSSVPLVRRLIDEMKSTRLRVVLDPANLVEVASDHERREIVARAIDQLGGRIVMAHAKDRDAKGGIVAAGRGVIDFGHFAGCLRRAGFAGPLVTHGLSESEAPLVALYLKKVLAA